ncbi:hypothetical protein C2845_PM09G22130 [Panicum miliaceum]|uniref:Uncharacterized protein n=1 Tax=Panicum miliaceum TaxID=4540 RepID=A0A3L6S1P9_PANMI|nr:hypothetical protein C2845_PM09G22130 [Panicum miliaceum]
MQRSPTPEESPARAPPKDAKIPIPCGPSIYIRRSLAHLARLLQQSRSLAFPHLSLVAAAPAS